MISSIDELLAADLLEGLRTRDISDLRDLRVRCSAVEGDVSLVRRMTQGRLDIVGHEARRRSGRDRDSDLSALLYDLPDVLSDEGGGGGSTRAVDLSGPGPAAGELTDQLDRIASPSVLAGVSHLEQDTLNELIDAISQFEAVLSANRRKLHERIDAIQAEVGRRYREGEASVDQVLG